MTTNDLLQNDNFYPDASSVTKEVYYERVKRIYDRNILQNTGAWNNFSNAEWSERFTEFAMYALGKQGRDRYISALTSTSSKNELFTEQAKAPSAVIHWAYRAISVVHSKLMSVVMEPTIIPQDPVFNDERKMFEAQLRALKELQALLINKQAIMAEMGIDPENMPTTEAEMEQFMRENPKLKFTADVIDEIAMQLEANQWDNVRSLFNMSQIIWGIGGCISYVDQNDNYHFRYVLPNQMVLGYDETENFANLDEAGFRRYVTIFELASESNFSPEQIKKVALLHKITLPENFNAVLDNYMTTGYIPVLSPTTYPNINIKIPVMDAFICLTHANKYKAKPPKDGKSGVRLYPERPTKTGDNIVSRYYQVWHRCSWVINGDKDCVYRAEPLKNSIVKPYDPTRPQRPFHVFMPNKIIGENTSLVQTIIPLVDQAQIAFTHIQKLESIYVPPGYSIPLSRLQDIILDDTSYSPRELISTLKATGNMVYNDQYGIDNQFPSKIEPMLRPEYIAEINNWYNLMFTAMDRVNEICGLNSIVQGGNPNPEVGKAQSEIAVAGAENAIGHLYRAQNKFYEELCQDILINWQYKQLKDPKSYWHKIAQRQMIIKIVNGPTDQEWATLYGAAQVALNTGQLTIENFVMLQAITNLSKARAYLATVTRRNIAETRAAQQANIEAQAQGNIQAGVAAEQERGKNAAMNHQYDIEKIQLEHRNKMELATLQAQLEQGNIATKAVVNNESAQELQATRSQLKQDEMLTQQALQQQAQPQPEVAMEETVEEEPQGLSINELMMATE